MGGPMRGSVAAVGVGDTPYYKHGASPDSEAKLTLASIRATSMVSLPMPTTSMKAPCS